MVTKDKKTAVPGGGKNKTGELATDETGRRLGARDGFLAGVPVFIGYFPAAVAFGVLARAGGISLRESFLFSALVFAGASQFMALNLLQAQIAAAEIILATLLVNSRHLVMSATLAARLPKKRSWLILPAAFGITDETFAVAATREQSFSPVFLLSLGVTAYSGWVGGTVAGYLLGTTLPTALQNSMGIALYAMFAAILIPELKKNRHALFLAVGAGILHTVLTWGGLFSPGWNLIAAMVFSAALGACFFREKGE